MVEKKKSLKPIPPTLRGKKRYISFELISDSKFSEDEVKKEIWFSFGKIFGEKGIAEQKIWLMKWFPEKNYGVLRCNLKHEDDVKTGLLFISKISGKNVVPLLGKVSGSIKKLKLYR